MIIDEQHKDAFAEYKDSLFLLEKTFILAGLSVSFRCFVAPLNNKMVDVLYKNKSRNKLICIEGDSPAQAVKDVAAGVRL
jgi:hypothetical protein